MARGKRGRGRPEKCNKNQQRSVASLVKKFTAARAVEILAAGNKSEDAKLRPSKLFPEPVVLTIPTACRYAREHGVELKRGRPKAA